MASRHASQRKPGAVSRAVTGDRLFGVIGATRIKAAVRAEQRTQQQLISAKKCKQQRFHDASAKSLSINIAPSDAAMGMSFLDTPRFTRTITSKRSIAGRAARSISRNRLRNRLRSTALGIALPLIT